MKYRREYLVPELELTIRHDFETFLNDKLYTEIWFKNGKPIKTTVRTKFENEHRIIFEDGTELLIKRGIIWNSVVYKDEVTGKTFRVKQKRLKKLK